MRDRHWFRQGGSRGSISADGICHLGAGEILGRSPKIAEIHTENQWSVGDPDLDLRSTSTRRPTRRDTAGPNYKGVLVILQFITLPLDLYDGSENMHPEASFPNCYVATLVGTEPLLRSFFLPDQQLSSIAVD